MQLVLLVPSEIHFETILYLGIGGKKSREKDFKSRKGNFYTFYEF